MPIMINSAREHIIVHRAAPAFEPCQQARSSIWQQFELNGPPCFLLHYDCPRSDPRSADKVADLHLHQVAALKFAVDRQIEQRPISQVPPLIEIESKRGLSTVMRLERRAAGLAASSRA